MVLTGFVDGVDDGGMGLSAVDHQLELVANKAPTAGFEVLVRNLADLWEFASITDWGECEPSGWAWVFTWVADGVEWGVRSLGIEARGFQVGSWV